MDRAKCQLPLQPDQNRDRTSEAGQVGRCSRQMPSVLTWVSLSLLLLSTLLNSQPTLAEFRPPATLGKPGNREGAATRIELSPVLICSA